jgi:hypothetical protein
LVKPPDRKIQFRPLNLNAGDLVSYVSVRGFNSMSGKKGFVIKKSQERSPHRTDVYLVKFQNEDPGEVDERWLQRIFTDDEVEADDQPV